MTFRTEDRGVDNNHMYTQGPINIEGVAEKPVVAASESRSEHLVHGPGRGIVEKYNWRAGSSNGWLEIAVDFQMLFNFLTADQAAARLIKIPEVVKDILIKLQSRR